MKKIISSKLALFLGAYLMVICLFFAIVCLGAAFSNNTPTNEKLICLFGFIVFLAVTFLGLWCMNRGACVVWVENGIVKSKGLIIGFHKECPLSSIRSVKIKSIIHRRGFQGDFIFLVTDRTDDHKKFINTRKDSYLCFGKNKKNLEFLRTFWSGEIEE